MISVFVVNKVAYDLNNFSILVNSYITHFSHTILNFWTTFRHFWNFWKIYFRIFRSKSQMENLGWLMNTIGKKLTNKLRNIHHHNSFLLSCFKETNSHSLGIPFTEVEKHSTLLCVISRFSLLTLFLLVRSTRRTSNTDECFNSSTQHNSTGKVMLELNLT